MRNLTLGLGVLLFSFGCGSTHVGSDAAVDAGPDATVLIVDAGDTCPIEPEVHRPAASACSADRAMGTITTPNEGSACTTHAECTDGTNGRCQISDGRSQFYSCNYDRCFDDSECGSGPCVCGSGEPRIAPNSCLAGNCQTDADCGANGFCSPSLGSCGDFGGTVGYYCRTCEDECVNDSDCPPLAGGFGGGYCAYNEAAGHWACSNAQCAG